MAFAGTGSFHITETRGIVCDTRVFPPTEAPPKAIVCLELVVRGTFRGFGLLTDTFSEGTALALRHEHYQGADRQRPFAFRAEGEPLVIVEWHAPAEIFASLPTLPATLPLAGEAWAAATRAGILSCNDDAGVEEGLRALVKQLRVQGFITEAGMAKALRDPPAPIRGLWGALKPTIEHLALSTSAADLGASVDLSATQVERTVRRWATAFALVGPGLRSVTRIFRINAAVMFLSAEGATVADVAHATGYGSADAMARAFRDVGMASPSAVQKQLRGA